MNFGIIYRDNFCIRGDNMNIKKCFEVDVDRLKKYDMVKSIDRF